MVNDNFSRPLFERACTNKVLSLSLQKHMKSFCHGRATFPISFLPFFQYLSISCRNSIIIYLSIYRVQILFHMNYPPKMKKSYVRTSQDDLRCLIMFRGQHLFEINLFSRVYIEHHRINNRKIFFTLENYWVVQITLAKNTMIITLRFSWEFFHIQFLCMEQLCGKEL